MSKIRCEAYRSVWIEVPEDDGEYACPECGGTVCVEDEEAEHEDVEWVECPVNPGGFTLALLESEDGEDIACDHCEIENAITVSDGEVEHDDIEWIECPFTDGDGTVVYLDDDDEVDCDHCNGSIYIEDGDAEHEDYDDVACPLNKGETTTVFLGDDREEECDHCGGTITIEDGEAEHEEPDDPDCLPAKKKKELEKRFRKELKTVDEDDADHAIENYQRKAKSLANNAFEYIRLLVKQTTLLWFMLRDWWNDEYELPWKTASAIVVALVYFINPFDAIPDAIPVIGYLDDASIVYTCLTMIRADLEDYCESNDIDAEEYGIG